MRTWTTDVKHFARHFAERKQEDCTKALGCRCGGTRVQPNLTCVRRESKGAAELDVHVKSVRANPVPRPTLTQVGSLISARIQRTIAPVQWVSPQWGHELLLAPCEVERHFNGWIKAAAEPGLRAQGKRKRSRTWSALSDVAYTGSNRRQQIACRRCVLLDEHFAIRLDVGEDLDDLLQVRIERVVGRVER